MEKSTFTRILSFIPEELLKDIYLKVSNHAKGHMFEVDTKFRFYLSIVYDGKVVRSRTLDSKNTNDFDSGEEENHKKFYQKVLLGKNENIFQLTQEKSDGTFINILRIGKVSIIVSNGNYHSVRICAGIIAILYLQYKAFSLKKEGTQLSQLVRFLEEENDTILIWYLKEASRVKKGGFF